MTTRRTERGDDGAGRSLAAVAAIALFTLTLFTVDVRTDVVADGVRLAEIRRETRRELHYASLLRLELEGEALAPLEAAATP